MGRQTRIRSVLFVGALAALAAAFLGVPLPHAASDETKSKTEPAPPVVVDPPATVEAARGRARLMHETLHGVLQVMHRDFFRENEGLRIPSHSLEEVFEEVERNRGVSLRWLAVNASAMSIDHEPQDDFERRAVKAIAAGKDEFDAVEGDLYRHAGRIRLSSGCLKCHVTARTDSKDRAAALVITLPMKKN